MFCKSRILEGQEWRRRKELGDELYQQAKTLKYPLDPAETVTFPAHHMEILAQYKTHEADRPERTLAQENEEAAAAAGWDHLADDLLDCEGVEQPEEDEEQPLCQTCPRGKQQIATTTCPNCFADICQACRRGGCSSCGEGVDDAESIDLGG
eukprot:gene12188-biopygen2597